MFTTEQEMQAFDQYQAMQEREFARQARVAAQEMIKEGCSRSHWPMVAAGYQALAQSTIANEAAVCAKSFRRYRKMATAEQFEAARVELQARAARRMVA